MKQDEILKVIEQQMERQHEASFYHNDYVKLGIVRAKLTILHNIIEEMDWIDLKKENINSYGDLLERGDSS